MNHTYRSNEGPHGHDLDAERVVVDGRDILRPRVQLSGNVAEAVAMVSHFGDLSVAHRTPLVGSNFPGSVANPPNPVQWATTLTGSGTALEGTGELNLRTGATANSTVLVQLNHVARFIAGTANRFCCVSRLSDTGVANNVRRWGAYDAQNGFFFELNGTTLRTVSRKGGVDTVVASGSFNGELGTNRAADTNSHHYEIEWYEGSAEFFIDHHLLHEIAEVTPLVLTGSLRMSFENVNSGGSTTDASLFVHNAMVFRRGDENQRPVYAHLGTAGTTTIKDEPGTLHRVVVNTAGAAGATVTLYDNTSASGPIIAVIAATTITTLIYDLDFDTGLTVAIAAPGGQPDVTVVYD